MTDAMRFPGGEMADLYSHRWEIELGYREIKTDDATEQADAEK
ncbi:putative transposase [Shigella flexneri VA-6]|nr:putative transposase [Shigella flexneri VA-6]